MPKTKNIVSKNNNNYNNYNNYINCNECKLLIDMTIEYYVFNNKHVCNICYNKLNTIPNVNDNTTQTTSNINLFTIPPIPPMPPTQLMPPMPPMPPTQPELPKIRLIFVKSNKDTVKDLQNKNNKKVKDKDNKNNKDNKDNKDKHNDCNDCDDKDNRDKRDTRNTRDTKDTNTTAQDDDDDDTEDETAKEENAFVGKLFLESIINRLNKCDNVSINTEHRANIFDGYFADKDVEDANATAKLEYEWLGLNIKTIDDLIELGKSYNSRKRKRHNLNLKLLNRLVEPLTELQNMIGMQDVKKIVFDQIIYYLQQLDDKNVDMLHTVIVGPPGVGKTQLTHILAKIYNRLGFLKTDKVICVKRDDLIGEYIGQTAPKTRKILDKALGGVLLLDEIYSLSPSSERDFAKEAIDMINMYLSEHAHDLVCIVAGYKKPTYEKFFSQNEGLARRFTHHFEIKGYTAEELTLIFKKYLEEQKWQISTTASIEDITKIIKQNMDIFPNYGGDMTTLFACCKKTHSRRLLNIPTEEELENTKKKIMLPDIIDGIKLFKDIKEKHSNEEEDKSKYINMYS